jgi:hypothetical protein
MFRRQAQAYAKLLNTHPEVQAKLQSQLKSLAPAVIRSFSSELAAKNYDKFKKKYTEHSGAFREKIAKIEAENIAADKKPLKKGYTHPYHSDHHNLVMSAVKISEYFNDSMGAEQVSPHYENFAMSRKYALIYFGGIFALMLACNTIDIQWIAKSTLPPFFFWLSLHYFYLEGRKSVFKPLLMRFYRRVAANEIYNFHVFYHENIEVKMRQLIRVTKGQMAFWQLHQEFQDVKAEAVNNFLSNEYLNLQRHIVDRSISLLKQAQVYEELNKSSYIQNILNEATAEVDRAMSNIKDENLQKKMLDSAITGLSKGYMDYENDPILPLVNEVIKKHVQKFNNLNEVERNRLMSLTEAQMSSLKDADKHAKHEFLTVQPKGLDPGLKNAESAKKIFNNWGQ